MPVKFLPNTSSSGGMRALGVVVSVTDRAMGSMPGSLTIPASLDCVL